MIINIYNRKIYQYVRNTKIYDILRTKISGVLSKNAVEKFYKNHQLFSHIEIETVNKCNGSCSFCPVNRESDTRKLAMMSVETFEKIIRDLKMIGYKDKVYLSSNNEPFIDPKLPARARYAREALQDCTIIMYTNGSLLTRELLEAVTPYIDRLIVDNYNDNLQLNPSSVMINELCKENDELDNKIRITIRKQHEILMNRAGQAPNRRGQKNRNKNTCPLPFFQMVIRPTGEVSLCCNDALGKMTLGNVNDSSLKEIWFSQEYWNIRDSLRRGRQKSNIPLCKACDWIWR
jgi:radical SAM protein with 4Fe4S-binding SPASM domain